MFKNLFNKKLKPLDLIEAKCKIKYPDELKKEIKVNGENLLFKLPDENYKILNSLTSIDSEDKLEDSVYLYEKLNSGKNASDFKKIPFARNMIAGKDKYLVFQNDTNRVFLTDNNGIISQLEISDLINLYGLNNSLQVGQINNLKLPNGIKNWSNSYADQKLKKTSNQNDLIAETFGTYYNSSIKEENIAKLEVQCTIVTKDFHYNMSSSYEIENPEIDRPLKYMLEYRMYYYNLWCLADCLNQFISKSDDGANLKSIINEFNLYEKAKNILRGQSVSKI